MNVIEKLNNICVFGSKTWFDIGVQLYELFDKSEEGLKLWIKYSETDQENFEIGTCEVMWSAFYEFFPNGSRDEDTPYILDEAFEIFTAYRNKTVKLQATVTTFENVPFIFVSNHDEEEDEDDYHDRHEPDDLPEWW